MKKESSFNLALPAALMPFVAPIAAQAAEGTGLVSIFYNFIILITIIFFNKKKEELVSSNNYYRNYFRYY